MKRRDLLRSIASVAGAAAVPAFARASATPCPPPRLSATGGSAVTNVCSSLVAPAWFTGMANNTWIGIAAGAGSGLAAAQSGNQLSDVAPNPLPLGNEGQQAIINDWTGACANQALAEYYLPAQGGHSGYYGNEVYCLNLNAAVPGWQRIWGPTPNSQILTSELGYNPPAFGHADGNPRTLHGWFNVFCDNGGNLWVTMIDANPSGAWGTNTYSIARSNLGAGWVYNGRLFPSVPGGSPGSSFGWQEGPGAFDPVSNQIWKSADFATSDGTVTIKCASTFGAGAQSQSSGPQVPGSTVYNTYLPGSGLTGGWSVVLSDKSPRCWVAGNLNSSNLAVMDLVNNPGVWNSVATSGSGQWNDGDGAVYLPGSNAIYVYGVGNGATIKKLSINGNNPLTASYTWSQVSPASGNSVTPTAFQPSQFNGVYSKLQIIENMGNGQAALVVACGISGPTYVYKMPAGGA
jgi:hypothetical protein